MSKKFFLFRDSGRLRQEEELRSPDMKRRDPELREFQAAARAYYFLAAINDLATMTPALWVSPFQI